MKQWAVIAAFGAAALTGCHHTTTAAKVSDTGGDLLEKAEVAAVQTDYDGLMVSEADAGAAGEPTRRRSMQIMCYFKKPGLSRYEYRTGPAKGLIVAQGRDFGWRYEPALKHFVISARPARPDSSHDLLLQQNYRTIVKWQQKIAGRDAAQVDVLPRRGSSPWRRFWIDKETYVVLGQERFGPHGRLQSRSEFQSVEYKNEPDSLFSPPQIARPLMSPVEMAKSMTLAQLQHAVGFPVVAPRWLPKGYHSGKNYLTKCEDGCGAPVALTRFTDGVDNISIFQSHHVMPGDAGGSCQIKNTGSVREARLVKNNIDYVVVGDLDGAQLQRIAQSIPSVSAGLVSPRG